MSLNFLAYLGLIFFLVGCGDSPFLEEDSGNHQTQVIQGLETGLLFASAGITVKSYWRDGPNIGDESKLLIVLLGQDGTPLSEDLDLRLKLWMPTMGHGSFPVTLSRLANGVYEAREIFFTMPGYWDIHFQIFQENNLDEEVKWGLNL